VIPPSELAAVFGTEQRPDEIEDLRGRSFASTVGVWRVRVEDDSAVVKVLRLGAAPTPTWGSEPDLADVFYWRREVEAYLAPVIHSNELRMPAVRLVAERNDGSVALWLEDLGPEPDWTVAGIAAFAGVLGRFQASTSLRSEEWLARDWFNRYLEVRAEWAERGGADAWPRRDEILTAMHAAPATLGHNDLHPFNVFVADDAFVVIDWAFAGAAPLGGDAGILAADALFDNAVPIEEGPELIGRVWVEYAAGLREAGASEERIERARYVYIEGNKLRYAWIPGAIATGATPEEHSARYAAAYELLAAQPSDVRP
jgi:Phosphotransferase enzyme family